MKKSIFTLLLLATLVSCSKDDCIGNYDEIYNHYQQQIEHVIANPIPGWGVDYRKINLLKQERDGKLANACR
jgi:hypothetical protein